jgi:UDP-GlcNAc:undecaprenyl-phosphate GlcNAc-1-phosphate transferase
MGDTGSLLLGFSLSALAVRLVQNGGGGFHLSPVTVAAVLGLPIIDTLLVMARRIRIGANPFHPDKTHLHHRLMDLGLPHSVVVTILYFATAAFGFAAWSLRLQPEWLQFAAVLSLGAAIHFAVSLARRGGQGIRVLMSSALDKSVSLAGWVIGTGLFLPTAVLNPIPRSISIAALAAGAFVMTLFPWRAKAARSSVSNGIMYSACLSLLWIFHFSPGAPAWLPSYFAVFSAAVAGWVVLNIVYRGHREILSLSAFEMLFIGVSWFIPIVLVPAVGWDDGIRRLMFAVCLESGVFLLAMKILVRRQPTRNLALVATILIALAIIGAKGYLVPDVVASPVPKPADVKQPAAIQISSASILRRAIH